MGKSDVLYESETVKCANCGKDLFESLSLSMVQIATNDNELITRVVPCCKGECDRKLKSLLRENEHDGWKDLEDFTNPYLFLKHIMSVLNCMYEDKGFENEEAFEAYKDLIIKCYPYISKSMTEKEKESARMSEIFPF